MISLGNVLWLFRYIALRRAFEEVFITLNPAARIGVCPPPTKQCHPRLSRARSRRIGAQFNGSSG